eukprot:scaffold5020_cov258-Pinguiococcus_pyrenoidosus.AAC.5
MPQHEGFGRDFGPKGCSEAGGGSQDLRQEELECPTAPKPERDQALASSAGPAQPAPFPAPPSASGP